MTAVKSMSHYSIRGTNVGTRADIRLAARSLRVFFRTLLKVINSEPTAEKVSLAFVSGNRHTLSRSPLT